MKVQPFQILKPLGENLIVQVDEAKAFYNQLHKHNEIQLSLIIKGNGKLVVGDSIHQFKKGDFFVIGANSPHLFKSDEAITKVKMITLFFTKTSFGKEFFDISELEEIAPFFENIQVGFQLLSSLNEVKGIMEQLPSASKFSRLMLFFELLQVLSKADKKPLADFIYPKEIGLIAGERMKVIFDFVFQNFQNEITLQRISSLIYMTPNAFCKFFKQRTNKTFFQFLIELRIEHASQLLQKNRDVSILEISEASGFKSISNFNRKFKYLKGTIPSEYRRKHLIENFILSDTN